MSETRWLAEHREDGRVVFRIGRQHDQLVAEWLDLATLTAPRDGSSFELAVVADAPRAEVEKVRRGSAALLLRQLRGELAFHGAAVALDGQALVFLGRSGQGKSTLAASLCARAGASLLSDDAVALDGGPASAGYRAAPMETNHWLEAESGAKRAVAALRCAAASAPLVAVIDLAFADVALPRLVALGGVHAVAALVPQVARFVLDEPEVQCRELEAIAALVEHVPIYRLERPRAIDRVDDAHPILIELVRRETRPT